MYSKVYFDDQIFLLNKSYLIDKENLDNQKPIFDILSGIVVFPIIFYHAKFLEMERWLKE